MFLPIDEEKKEKIFGRGLENVTLFRPKKNLAIRNTNTDGNVQCRHKTYKHKNKYKRKVIAFMIY